jgi:hypothetical protein
MLGSFLVLVVLSFLREAVNALQAQDNLPEEEKKKIQM